MKIAQIAPLIFPVPPRDHGGTERVIHDLTSALCAQGHDVKLFAADGSRTCAELIPQGPAVSTYDHAPPSLPSAMECVMLDRVASMADEFDIIHCHTELYHSAVLRPWADKLVMTIHWRADEMDRTLYFDHFRDVPVAAISRSQELSLPASNRAGVVHHGIGRDELALSDGGGAYCAFLGRMTDQKRPDLAIEIAQKSGMPIRLGGTVDVGNPRYFDEHVKPRLGDAATYVGPITQTQKQAFLGNAEVFLFPIDWPEPFGLVMIEAMACGTPVVAYDRGSVREIIEPGVTGYIVDSVEEAVEATIEARSLDRKRIRAEFEARFTSERMAADYTELYERILAGKRGG